MTHEKPPLSFNVRCTACYGMAIWTLGHISRLLIAAGQLSPSSATDVEYVAAQFIAYHKHILCPDCNKKDVLIVQRIVPEE